MNHPVQTGELRSPTILLGDCAEKMRDLAPDSIDAIVTDPPYGLAFMGAKWDNFGANKCGNDSIDERRRKAKEYRETHKGCGNYPNSHSSSPTQSDMVNFQAAMTPIFAEALRVAKPGAHLLAFGGTRTYHRLACAIEDAGWEIRDCIMWVYGSGFPKGQNVGKQVEALLKHGKTGSRTLRQVEQEGDGKPYTVKAGRNGILNPLETWERKEFTPELDAAKEWDGWNTQLKPAVEPIVVARKPLDGTVAANVLKHGTGALNIDACRVPAENESVTNHSRSAEAAISKGKYGDSTAQETRQTAGQQLGRFPANLVHDGSDEVLALFPDSKGQCGAVKGTESSRTGSNGIYGNYSGQNTMLPRGDSGSAARFFYCAKASRSERNAGCEGLPRNANRVNAPRASEEAKFATKHENDHPTVKPIALMRYLVRLVTRPGGLVLDPFMGSGTTGVAAIQEGMNFVGIERDEHYYEIASRRIAAARPEAAKPTQQELPL